MVDSFARILALAAMDAATNGGSGEDCRGIENVYIEEGNLHIVFTDGLDTDLGKVVGEDGKIYVPHLSDDKILSWTIEDKPQELPPSIDLDPNDEWQPVEDDGETDYIWEDM